MLDTILAGYDIIGYSHTADHLKRLYEKIEDPSIQAQLKTCTEAYSDYKHNLDLYHSKTDNEDLDLYGLVDQSHWWLFESMSKFVALIDDECTSNVE